MFSGLNVSPGKHTEEHFLEKDNGQITLMKRKSTDSTKQRRKSLRAQPKGFADTIEEKKGNCACSRIILVFYFILILV